MLIRQVFGLFVGASILVALSALPVAGATLRWLPDNRQPPSSAAEINDFVTAIYPPVARTQNLEDVRRVVLQHILGTLRAQGYLDAKVSFAAEESSDEIRVEAGTVYTLASINVTGLDPKVRNELPEDAIPARFRALLGKPLDEAQLDRAQSGLVADLRFAAYGLAKVKGAVADKNAEAHLVTWQVVVDTGPPLVFGPLHVEGASRSNVGAILKSAPYATGAPFRPTVLQTLRDYLENEWHFRNVRVFPVETATSDGKIDVIARVDEPPLNWHDLNQGWEAAEIATAITAGAFAFLPLVGWSGRSRRWRLITVGGLLTALLVAGAATVLRLLFLMYP